MRLEVTFTVLPLNLAHGQRGLSVIHAEVPDQLEEGTGREASFGHVFPLSALGFALTGTFVRC